MFSHSQTKGVGRLAAVATVAALAFATFQPQAAVAGTVKPAQGASTAAPAAATDFSAQRRRYGGGNAAAAAAFAGIIGTGIAIAATQNRGYYGDGYYGGGPAYYGGPGYYSGPGYYGSPGYYGGGGYYGGSASTLGGQRNPGNPPW